jgi:hypothetical protein
MGIGGVVGGGAGIRARLIYTGQCARCRTWTANNQDDERARPRAHGPGGVRIARFRAGALTQANKRFVMNMLFIVHTIRNSHPYE